MRVEAIFCDVCRAAIQDGDRSFSMSVSVTMRNGEIRKTTQDFADLCSQRCLLSAHHRTIAELEKRP